jgi:glycosyltransferase involved in cell wall biosynthesis
MLLLNIWRTLAAQGAPVPKLVLVGLRGWDNDQALQFLERSELLAPHVRMVSGLSSVELRQIIGNARALLTPSFAEGYGLPIVEALSLGVPVIASDIPVFREVARDCATFLSPIDGTGWRETIKAFSGARPDLYAAALAQAKNFAAPNWAGYFDGIEAFLATL